MNSQNHIFDLPRCSTALRLKSFSTCALEYPNCFKISMVCCPSIGDSNEFGTPGVRERRGAGFGS